MNLLLHDKIKSDLKAFLPSLATAIIFCTVLLIKGIYPFGSATIDFYDLSDQGTPIYLHIYDAVHGHKNLFYDLYSALTTNMTGMLGTSGLSPFNFFLLFIKRESVLKCMSIFILLKMMVMSLGMYLFLDKTTKADYIYKLIFSVCYGFSGYILLHYTSHIWFDNVAYFPFVMLGLYLLVKEGKSAMYTISMTLSIICGYYISFLFFIYIFLILGLAVVLSKINLRAKPLSLAGNLGNQHIVSNSNDMDFINDNSGFLFRTDTNFHLIKLLVCTIVSILASSFILIPQFIQTFSSARFTNESGGGILGMYTGILKNVTPAYTSRWFVILNISLPAAIIAIGLLKFRKDKKLAIFTIGSIIIVCAELLFENINLFWHYGSYVHYPLRNGFMIGFTMSYLACIYLEKIKNQSNKKSNTTVFFAVFSCLCIFITASAIYLYTKNPGMSQRSVFHMLAAFMAVCAIVYALLILWKDGKYAKFAAVLVVCELIFYGFIFIGEPAYVTGYTEEPEMERDSYYICNRIYDAFNLAENPETPETSNEPENSQNKIDFMNIMNRVKNPDESLNSNYALVLRRSALSNWTALISPKLQDSARRLGYSVQYTRLLDSGGTVFSDALIGVKNIITCVPQDENLYELIDTADIVINQKSGETDTYYYYRCKYTLPWGIQLKNTETINFNENDTVKLYNDIYSDITENPRTPEASMFETLETEYTLSIDDTTHKSNEIAAYIPLAAPADTPNSRHLSQDIAISGQQALYYFANQVDTDDYNTTIKVNGEVIQIPSISEKENTLYPAHFNNNAVYLGCFDNENVSIDIDFSLTDKCGNEILSEFEPRLMTIDLKFLSSLCESYKDYNAVKGIEKTSYELEVNAENSGYIMLPLSYDKGYRAYVNDKDEQIEFLGGLFIALPVNAGQNSIRIKFMPAGFVQGVVISAVTVILSCLLYCLYCKKCRIKPQAKGKCVILEKIYIAVWCAAVLLIYVIPVSYAIISMII